MEPQEGGPAAPDAASERDASAKRVQGAPPQLLELWSRADLADAVVDFLPAKAIAGLSVVAKPLREAQARVVHAAARRRNRSEAVTRAAFQALEAGEPFWETWNGSWEQRWETHPRDAVNYYFAVAGTPPRLTLGRYPHRSDEFHTGLRCQFSDVGRRVTRFRVQVAIETSNMIGSSILHRKHPSPSGIAAITESIHGEKLTTGNGICFCKNRDTPSNAVSLCWFNHQGLMYTLVHSVNDDELFTIDISFSYKNELAFEQHMSQNLLGPPSSWDSFLEEDECVGFVSVNGGPPVGLLTKQPLAQSIHLWSLEDEVYARYGEIGVWCEPA